MITDESMFEAYYDCRKRKRGTANATAFEVDFESRIISLVRAVSTRGLTCQAGVSHLSYRDPVTGRFSPPIFPTVYAIIG